MYVCSARHTQDDHITHMRVLLVLAYVPFVRSDGGSQAPEKVTRGLGIRTCSGCWGRGASAPGLRPLPSCLAVPLDIIQVVRELQESRACSDQSDISSLGAASQDCMPVGIRARYRDNHP